MRSPCRDFGIAFRLLSTFRWNGKRLMVDVSRYLRPRGRSRVTMMKHHSRAQQTSLHGRRVSKENGRFNTTHCFKTVLKVRQKELILNPITQKEPILSYFSGDGRRRMVSGLSSTRTSNRSRPNSMGLPCESNLRAGNAGPSPTLLRTLPLYLFYLPMKLTLKFCRSSRQQVL
jgi:hypothetical protein